MNVDRAKSELAWIPFDQLVPHSLNANVMSDELRTKLTANIRATGRYPPLVVQPLDDDRARIRDGRHRAEVLRNLGEEGAWCYLWPATDDEALILVATLNRLEGQDAPGRRAALIAELESHRSLAELAQLLPETEAELEATLDHVDLDVDSLLVGLSREAELTAVQGPQLFTFAVDTGDAPTVRAAIDSAVSTLSGRNRRGQALVLLSQKYLKGG